MAERPKIDLGLTGYDELFMDDKERQEIRLPRIHDIPLDLIDDFPGHPYQVRMDEDMDQLVESIKERGIITPVKAHLDRGAKMLYSEFKYNNDFLLGLISDKESL